MLNIKELYSPLSEISSRIFTASEYPSLEVYLDNHESLSIEELREQFAQAIAFEIRSLPELSTVVLSGILANSAMDIAQRFPQYQVIAVAESEDQPDPEYWFAKPAFSLYSRLIRTQISNGVAGAQNLWIITDLEKISRFSDDQILSVRGLPAKRRFGNLQMTRKVIEFLALSRLLQMSVTRAQHSLSKVLASEVENLRELKGRIQSISVVEDRLYLSGVASIESLGTSNYGSQTTVIHLNRAGARASWPLGQTRSNAADIFSDDPEQYGFSGFATLRNSGIDLGELAQGRYSIEIEVRHPSAERTRTLELAESSQDEQRFSAIGEKAFHLTSDPADSQVVLEVMDIPVGQNLPRFPGKTSLKDGIIILKSSEFLGTNNAVLTAYSSELGTSFSEIATLEGDRASFKLESRFLQSGTFHLVVSTFGECPKSFLMSRDLHIETPHKIPSVALVGSHVTLDVFDPEVNRRDRHSFEVIAQLPDHLMTEHSEWNDAQPLQIADAGAKSLESHLQFKQMMQEITQRQPDFLIVDLRNDVVSELSYDDEELFLEIFKEGVTSFVRELKAASPDTKIFLHGGRELSEYSIDGKRVWFDSKKVARNNELWHKLDTVFAEVSEVQLIDIFDASYRSDPNHPRGALSTHFESKYYRDFLRHLQGQIPQIKKITLKK